MNPASWVTPPRGRQAGFTLLELMAVVLLIAMVLAVAIPRYAPAIAYGKVEGAARHLAGYGRAALAHCALTRERVTVRIDLDEQAYWSVRWIAESESLFDDDEEGAAPETPAEFLERARATLQATSTEANQEENAKIAADMEEQFERFFRVGLEMRTRNVTHDGFLADVGPDFKEFDLDQEDEDDTEEIRTDLLSRTAMPEGVLLESVRVGTEEYTEGVAEVDLTPTGFGEPVRFYLRDRDAASEDLDEYFTVTWDPITSGCRLERGKEGIPE